MKECLFQQTQSIYYQALKECEHLSWLPIPCIYWLIMEIVPLTTHCVLYMSNTLLLIIDEQCFSLELSCIHWYFPISWYDAKCQKIPDL